jgi:cysteine desulfurase / selenocysteine lyase
MMIRTEHPDRVQKDRTFDVQAVRAEFPGLEQHVHQKPLVYLDNAATTQRPRAVIDAVSKAMRDDCANVHRGVHELSVRATRAFEAARGRVASFIRASSPNQIVFTKGATEAVNIVASSFAGERLKEGDEILVSELEHHANIVPWQLLAKKKGLVVRPIRITDDGEIDLDALKKMIGKKTGMIAVSWVSNALGTVSPVAEIVRLAEGVPVLVDAAQALPHIEIDVGAIGCDFLVFSAHKAYGPTGVGALWGKKEHLASMPPYQGGGDMIASVSFAETTFREPPARFEAGTPNISGVIGFGAAIEWMSSLDLLAARAHEHALLELARARLSELPGVKIFGKPKQQAGAISFSFEDVHPHDIGTVLDSEGIAIRAGHHCAQPLMDRFSVPATARASFAVYNTRDEVDALVRGLSKVKEVFGG